VGSVGAAEVLEQMSAVLREQAAVQPGRQA
jgi:hypothetical protein